MKFYEILPSWFLGALFCCGKWNMLLTLVGSICSLQCPTIIGNIILSSVSFESMKKKWYRKKKNDLVNINYDWKTRLLLASRSENLSYLGMKRVHHMECTASFVKVFHYWWNYKYLSSLCNFSLNVCPPFPLWSQHFPILLALVNK